MRQSLAVDAAKPVLFHPQIHTQFFVIQHARDEIRRATIEEIYNKLQADLREVSSELESLRAIPVAQGNAHDWDICPPHSNRESIRSTRQLASSADISRPNGRNTFSRAAASLGFGHLLSVASTVIGTP